MRLTFLELFAGAGGLSMGLERAGMACVGHAEINPHARAVLRYRWPDVPLEGDVSALDGARYRGIDVLTGGSPCQDLSIAGKRRGLAGARSSLFHQQARIWNESGAPYLLWENVPGALSSNNGADFAVVLGTLVGAPIPVPKDGWGSAGVAAGPAAVAAFRVLDLQHFGPPQRRARVFVLAARAGGVDPAEVLALSEGLCGHPSPRDQQREGAARGVPAGARGGDRVTLSMDWQKGEDVNNPRPSTANVLEEETNTIRATARPAVLAVNISDGEPRLSDVLSFDPLNNDASDTATHSLRSNGSGTVGPIVTVTGDVTHALRTSDGGVGEDGTGRGTPIVVASGQANAEAVEGGCPTLTLLHEAPILVASEVADSLTVGANQTTGFHGDAVVSGRPRRLMPVECERLMSWPDDHTRWGVDEQGRRYELKDTPRYQLCGNGVGSDCTAWIGERLVAAVAALNARQERVA